MPSEFACAQDAFLNKLFSTIQQWLKYIAHRYKADFHHPDLMLDDDAVTPQTRPPAEYDHTNNSDSEEEEEIFHFDWGAERLVLAETRGRRDPIE